MFGRLRRRRQVLEIRSRVREAQRAGTGVYMQEWPPAGAASADTATLVAEVMTWCRQTLGATRRPYGIDQFDLALCVDEGGDRPRSTRFSRVRPMDLYVEGALDARVADWISSCGRQPLHVGAALLSWGDMADAALPTR